MPRPPQSRRPANSRLTPSRHVQCDAENIGKVSASGNAAFLGTTHKYLSEVEKKRTFDDTLAILKDTVEIQPQGHAIDKEYPGAPPSLAAWLPLRNALLLAPLHTPSLLVCGRALRVVACGASNADVCGVGSRHLLRARELQVLYAHAVGQVDDQGQGGMSCGRVCVCPLLCVVCAICGWMCVCVFGRVVWGCGRAMRSW